MDKLKKILKIEWSGKFLAILGVIALILITIPTIMLARYMVPSADDYGYTLYTHNIWEQTHNIGQVFHYASFQARESWYAWQGTYSSIFLMSLAPFIFGDQFYFLGTVIILFVLFSGIILFFYSLLHHLFGEKKGEAGALSIFVGCVSAWISMETMWNKVQGIFWYNAAIHYIFMTGVMLLMISCIIFAATAEKIGKTIVFYLLSAACALLLGGANYVNALEGLILLISTLVLAFLMGHKKALGGIAVVIFYGVCFYQSIIAPGNVVRAASYQAMKPFDAILLSFKTAIRLERGWTNRFYILILLLLLPMLWNMARKSKFNFIFFPFVWIFSFCVVAASFTPTLYSTGGTLIGRAVNVSKILFLIMGVINLWAFCGFVNRLLCKKNKDFRIPQSPIYIVMIMALVGIVILKDPNPAGNYTTYGAYFYLIHTDEAKQYNAEYQARRELIDNGGDDIVLPEYQVTPEYLFFEDITDNPEDWRNIQMANWYHKASIVIP